MEIRSDSRLSEQVEIQAFLNASSSGPVPEILLYRLLTIAEIALIQKFPISKLEGLCLGYTLGPKDSTENEAEFYYVSWGWLPTYSVVVEPGEDTELGGDLPVEDSPEVVRSSNPIDEEIIQISKLFESEIVQWLPEEVLGEKDFSVFLFGHFRDTLVESSRPPVERFSRESREAIDLSRRSRFSYTLRGRFRCNCPSDSKKRKDPNNSGGPCLPCPRT